MVVPDTQSPRGGSLEPRSLGRETPPEFSLRHVSRQEEHLFPQGTAFRIVLTWESKPVLRTQGWFLKSVC